MNYTKADKVAAHGTGRARGARSRRFLSPLHKANRQAAVHLEGQLDGLGMSGPEAHLMSYLQVYGPCRVGELVRVFGYKKPTMTSILDRLAGRGLVTRRLNPSDRRSFLVDLTAAGGRLATVVRRLVERFDDDIARHVAPQHIEGFERVMGAIAAITGVELRESGRGKTAAGLGVGSRQRRRNRGS